MTIETAARITLALFFIAALAAAIWRHGKTVKQHRFHAATVVFGVAVETVLIFFAGGWGEW